MDSAARPMPAPWRSRVEVRLPSRTLPETFRASPTSSHLRPKRARTDLGTERRRPRTDPRRGLHYQRDESPGRLLDAGWAMIRDVISSADAMLGESVAKGVASHHRRRLERVGWGRAFDPSGGVVGGG